jgi:RNA polymerase sigma-70 factor (ECF subfamily)
LVYATPDTMVIARFGGDRSAESSLHPPGAGERIYPQGMGQAAEAPLAADETLARARAGDHAAFTEILSEHQAMVFSLAYHFVRDRSTAEELAQEVFLDLYRDLAHIDSAAHLTFWLRRVTSHRCIDRVRRESHRRELALGTVPERSLPPVPRDLLLEDLLRRFVAELPECARMVVTLRYQEDLEPSEIAEVLDMPVNTVKSHLRRSIAILRAKLVRREGGP